MALTYFAQDGNYGAAEGLVIIDTQEWKYDDWQDVDQTSDLVRSEQARSSATKYDGLVGPAVIIGEDEIPQVMLTLETVINYLTSQGLVGWAEELGDVRDVLERTTYSVEVK